MSHVHTTSERSGPTILSSHVGVRCLPEALPALRAARVSLARFEYSGQGGVRRLKPTTYHDETGRSFSVGVPKTVRQDIDIFFHELLDLRFPAWAYAEGSRGEFERNAQGLQANPRSTVADAQPAEVIAQGHGVEPSNQLQLRIVFDET